MASVKPVGPCLVQHPRRVARVLWGCLRRGRHGVSPVGHHLASPWALEEQEILVWWWLPACWLAPVWWQKLDLTVQALGWCPQEAVRSSWLELHMGWRPPVAQLVMVW